MPIPCQGNHWDISHDIFLHVQGVTVYITKEHATHCRILSALGTVNQSGYIIYRYTVSRFIMCGVFKWATAQYSDAVYILAYWQTDIQVAFPDNSTSATAEAKNVLRFTVPL